MESRTVLPYRGSSGRAGARRLSAVTLGRTRMLASLLFWSILTGLAATRTIARRGSPAGAYQTFWRRFWAGLADNIVLAPIGLLDGWVATSAFSWSLRALSFTVAALAGDFY